MDTIYGCARPGSNAETTLAIWSIEGSHVGILCLFYFILLWGGVVFIEQVEGPEVRAPRNDIHLPPKNCPSLAC